jgi:hypothetical protein
VIESALKPRVRKNILKEAKALWIEIKSK